MDRLPGEIFPRVRDICNQSRGIAGTARIVYRRDRRADNFADSVDYLGHRISVAGAEIENIRPAPVDQSGDGPDMGIGGITPPWN